jgi:hypothetical protein
MERASGKAWGKRKKKIMEKNQLADGKLAAGREVPNKTKENVNKGGFRERRRHERLVPAAKKVSA